MINFNFPGVLPPPHPRKVSLYICIDLTFFYIYISSGVTAFFHRWYNVAPQRWNLVEYKDFEIYACTFTYPWQHNREWSCLYFLKLIILICKNNKQEFCKWLDKSLKFRNNYYIFNILYLFCIYFIYEGVLFNLLDLLLKLII